MAGEWLKIRHDLPEDPAVIGIAGALGIEEDCVVGKLHRLWSWADKQTISGNAPTVTETFVDRYVGASGFAQAMVTAGWLVIHSDGITFPNFDTHISETAKQRALTARRAAKHRSKSNASSVTVSVTKSAPREEKRREESKKKTTSSKKGRTFVRPTVAELAAYCEERRNGIVPQAFIDHYDRVGWVVGRNKTPMRDWRAAVRTWEHLRKEEQTDARSTQNSPGRIRVADYSGLENYKPTVDDDDSEASSSQGPSPFHGDG